MDARVKSVNLGTVQEVSWGRKKSSAIDKRPAATRVAVGPLGLAGDQVADHRHHGGVDQAVYAYAREDLDAWAADLGRDLDDGQFGENLTTVGLDVQGARMGERWRIGSALLEVCDVRIPCRVFQSFLGEPRWVRRFAERGVPGAYLRVVEDGEIGAGDEIVVEETREHDLTVALTFRARTTETHLLDRYTDEPRLSAGLLRAVVARRDGTSR
jgi:MOSC domain-containing protein YiiM